MKTLTCKIAIRDTNPDGTTGPIVDGFELALTFDDAEPGTNISQEIAQRLHDGFLWGVSQRDIMQEIPESLTVQTTLDLDIDKGTDTGASQ